MSKETLEAPDPMASAPSAHAPDTSAPSVRARDGLGPLPGSQSSPAFIPACIGLRTSRIGLGSYLRSLRTLSSTDPVPVPKPLVAPATFSLSLLVESLRLIIRCAKDPLLPVPAPRLGRFFLCSGSSPREVLPPLRLLASGGPFSIPAPSPLERSFLCSGLHNSGLPHEAPSSMFFGLDLPALSRIGLGLPLPAPASTSALPRRSQPSRIGLGLLLARREHISKFLAWPPTTPSLPPFLSPPHPNTQAQSGSSTLFYPSLTP